MINAIHQIEITSRCDLRCRYCVHPKMARAKVDMDFATFDAAVKLAARFVRQGLQTEVNLAGIGESTLHPNFIEYMAHAREVCGPKAQLILATNGLNITKDPSLAEKMAPYKPRVWVSLHRPERAAGAVNALKEAGLLNGVSVDPSLAAIDWAGQVDWTVTAPDITCPWIQQQRVMVLSDGRIYSCCLDGRDDSDGKLFDDVKTVTYEQLRSVHVVPYSLCRTCSYKLPAGAA